MNPLDILLLGVIMLFVLFGKYSGFYLQLNRIISLVIAILIAKYALDKLIALMIPFVGLSSFTIPVVFYFSILSFYLISKFFLTIILFRYEPSKKKKFVHTILGSLFGMINGCMIIALGISGVLSVLSVNSQILLKLNESIIFTCLYNLNIILFSYAR